MNAVLPPEGQPPNAGEFLEKLRNALRKDGDFPASAKVVGELRKLVGDPKTTANQVTEVILREPALSLRILHLVNSSFYRRAKPIMTVSHAVVQVGMRPIAELCAGMVLVQRFISVARRGGAFATCLQKTLLTSLVTSALPSEAGPSSGKTDEAGYLSGSIAELGSLLLAYYFPQVYETAAKRSEQKRQELSKSIQEITGLSPTELSLEVVSALDLPAFYRDALTASERPMTAEQIRLLPGDKQVAAAAGRGLFIGRTISGVITGTRGKQQVDQTLQLLQEKTGVDVAKISTLLGQLPLMFKEHCQSLDVQLPLLPDFLSTYAAPASNEKIPAATNTEDSFTQFLEEIRASVASGEPTAAIITTVMETLAWSLRFDRVLLMLVGNGKRSLLGRMALGKLDNLDPRTIERAISARPEQHLPDAQAYAQSRPIFQGDSILPNGWPLMAIPIGFAPRTVGVIYADRTQNEADLTAREQAAIGVLAELLDRSVSGNG
jgi:HD-like signal output (HDOD) protein